MKKLFALTMIFLIAAVFTNSFAQSSVVYGTFNFDAKDVLWEYESGTIKISKSKGVNTVLIKFTHGGEVYLKNVEIKKNKITGSTQIEEETIEVTMKIVENELSGISRTSDGTEINFSGKRLEIIDS